MKAAIALLALALAACSAGDGSSPSSRAGVNDDGPAVNDTPARVNDDPRDMNTPPASASPMEEPDEGDEPSLPAPGDDPPEAASDGNSADPDGNTDPNRDPEGELPVPIGTDPGAEPLAEIGEACPVECYDEGDAEPYCAANPAGCESQWCSLDGVCVAPPPRDVPLGETCHDDAECSSEYCSPRAALFAPGTPLLTGWCADMPSNAAGWHDCMWRDGECVR